MIQDDEGLRRTHEAMLHLYLALAALKRQRDAMGPEWYAVMAEPAMENLFRLRRQVDQYLGLPAEWMTDEEAEHAGPETEASAKQKDTDGMKQDVARI